MRPAHETATRVNVYDGQSMALIARRIFLSDAMPDADEERAIATAELKRAGRYWVGGGAGPLFLLMLAR